MTALTWTLILLGVALNASAQLLLKMSTRPLAGLASFDLKILLSSLALLGRSVPFWSGMLCYGASLCVWMAALTKAPVSTAYPMLSLGYVVVAVVSVLSLDERLSLAQVLGIGLICAGVFLVTRMSA